jgi:hypothetical protein
LLTTINSYNKDYYWGISHENNYNLIWHPRPKDDYGIENNLKAISWKNHNNSRTFIFNI